MARKKKQPGEVRPEWERLLLHNPTIESEAKREIEYRNIVPEPIKVQVPLWEYFERMKRFRVDRWQKDLCNRLQKAAATRHKKRWWGVIHAEGQLGKPLDVETPVLMGDGSYKRLGDVKVGDLVITHWARPRKVLAVFDQGELPVLRITTHSGRTVLSALDHPFLTREGWVVAEDLSVGQFLASVVDAEGRLILRPALSSPFIEDRIVSIDPAGTAKCKCLTVEEDSTFTANDIVVHNTSIISQAFPAWLLGHDPLFRYALAMYNISRSENHSTVVINDMSTSIYKDIFPNRDGWIWKASDTSKTATAKSGWVTNARHELNDGQLSFNPVGLRSGLTGSGYDWLSIDDPYKEAQEAFSGPINEQMRNFYEYTVLSRTGLHSSISGMFHRYAPEDFAGFLLDTGDFDYIRYATQADGDYIHPSTGKRYPDPLGRAPGEYISPERRRPEYYDKARKNNRVWLSMFQGRPSSEEGDFFNVGKMNPISPEKGLERIDEAVAVCRAWDMAATDEAGAYSVAGKMSILPSGRVTIHSIWRKRVDTAVRVKKQIEIARRDGHDVTIVIPIDPGAAGKSVVYYTEADLSEFTVAARPTSGSKVQRALNFSVAVNSGMVDYVEEVMPESEEPWIPEMKKELRDFPLSDYKDICFVAGTMIRTPDGDRPIEDIRAGDLVLTRAGYKPVLEAGMTSDAAPVLTVYFSNGQHLTGTPAHPVFVEGRGFIRLDTLSDGDILKTWQSVNASSLTELNSFGIRRAKKPVPAGISTRNGLTLAEVSVPCTARSGNFTIIDRFRKAGTSIMQMGITSTMSRRIWSHFPRRSTLLNTLPHGLNLDGGPSNWSIWPLFAAAPLSGMGRRLATIGTSSMAGEFLVGLPQYRKRAASAGRSFRPKNAVHPERMECVSVQMPAPLVSAGERSGRTFSNHVLSAARSFWAKLGRRPVPVSVAGLDDGAARSKVYNLKVADQPEYFANGVLVHNCDALSDGYNHLWEISRRGTVVKNFKPQRHLITIDQFKAKFPNIQLNRDELNVTFALPQKWAIYAAVKLSQEGSRATSAVIVARATQHSDLPEDLFVLDEYKAYDANMYALFDWIKERMSSFGPDRDITIWLHPDSEQYKQTIASKLDFRVSQFTDDNLAGHNELNWYLLPTERSHPFGNLEAASHIYFITDPKYISAPEPDKPHSFYHARQEIATWGFDDTGDPTKVGDVMDCLRMITHRFKTYAERFTVEEEFDLEVRNRMGEVDLSTPEAQIRLSWAKHNAAQVLEEKYGAETLDEELYEADYQFEWQ